MLGYNVYRQLEYNIHFDQYIHFVNFMNVHAWFLLVYE